MGRTVRCFVFEKNGLRHMTRRMMEGLHVRGEALPEYAGTTQRMVHVFIEHVDRRPAKIIEARGYNYFFDQLGRLIPNREVEDARPSRLSDHEWDQVEAKIWPNGRG